jgi:hypothetical protein
MIGQRTDCVLGHRGGRDVIAQSEQLCERTHPCSDLPKDRASQRCTFPSFSGKTSSTSK